MLKLRLQDSSIIYKVPSCGGFFRDKYTCYFNKDTIGGRIKIDTGCTFTALALGDIKSKELKERAIRDFRSYIKYNVPEASYGVGVNDKNKSRPNIKLLSEEDFMNRVDIGFIHLVKDFTIGNINLGDHYVKIYYNRVGNSLLGMNILRRYESRITKENNISYFCLFNGEDILPLQSDIIGVLRSDKAVIGALKSALPIKYNEEDINTELHRLTFT